MNLKPLNLTLALCLASFSVLNTAAAQDSLSSDIEKQSYMLGVDIGNQLKSSGAEVDVKALSMALEHVFGGQKLLLDEQQLASIKANFYKNLQEKQQQQSKVMADTNKQAGEAFLAENKTKDGITTTESGLQYEVIEAGEGAKPKATDTVTVHYRGTSLDGAEFDSSYKRGQPTTFALNQVIPGWTEGVQLMSVGGKYKFYIPSELAYGARGAGGSIGPNSTLIFDVELIEIK